MIKIISITTLLAVLQSCNSPVIERNIDTTSLGKTSGVITPDAGKPSSGDQSNNPASSQPPNATVEILTTPSIVPTILAGATLTCVQANSNKALNCDVRVDGRHRDLKPTILYTIQGAQSDWTALPFTVIDVGEYTAAIGNMPASYGVAMKLEGGAFLLSSVGEEPLPFANILKDGSFEELPDIALADSESDFYDAASLLAAKSPWSVASSSVNGCPENDAFLERGYRSNKSMGGPINPYKGERFADLDSRCASGSGSSNINLGQDLKGSMNHIYQLSFAKRVAHESVSTIVRVGWGVSQSYTTRESSTGWKIDNQYFSYDVNGKIHLSVQEEDRPDEHGLLLDDMKVLDFGTPPK